MLKPEIQNHIKCFETSNILHLSSNSSYFSTISSHILPLPFIIPSQSNFSSLSSWPQIQHQRPQTRLSMNSCT
ncbi:hypothetical protein Peur_063481 [Populus x canadensis]